MRDHDTISDAGSLETQSAFPSTSVPIRDHDRLELYDERSEAQRSDGSGSVLEQNRDRSFATLWSRFKGRSDKLFMRDEEPVNLNAYPRVPPRFSASPKSLFLFNQGKSPSYLQMDGGEMVLRSFKERDDGTMIGLMEDGGVMFASRGPSRPTSGILQVRFLLFWIFKASKNHDLMSQPKEEEDWKFERQKSEVVRVVPPYQEDGSHIEQLANLFET